MDKIKLILETEGFTLRHVVKMTKYLTDMRDRDRSIEHAKGVFRRLEARRSHDMH